MAGQGVAVKGVRKHMINLGQGDEFFIYGHT